MATKHRRGASTSSSSGTSTDRDENEKEISMGAYDDPSSMSELEKDELYDFDENNSHRRRPLRMRSQFGQIGRTLRLGRIQRDIQSFISHPETQQMLDVFMSARNRERLQHHLSTLFLLLLPSFIYSENSSAKQKKLGKMAYLDGLRGVASLFVMGHHYSCQFIPALLEGWGSDVQPGGIHHNLWVFQLPLIRVVHAGPFMVNIFFVISGCVLSARGLRLAREGKQPEFLRSLSSSVFRRWLRLHLPVIASMCVAFIISRNEGWRHLDHDWLLPPGLENLTSVVQSDLSINTISPFSNVTVTPDGSAGSTTLLASPVTQPKFRLRWDWTGAAKHENITFQVGDFLGGVFALVDPFQPGEIPNLQAAGYNAGMILWTIPQEWLGSILVFFVVLGVAWLRSWLRLLLLALMSLWCHLRGKTSIATFLSGILIAELTLRHEEHLAQQSTLPPTSLSETPFDPDEGPYDPLFRLLALHRNEITTASWILLFLTGIYIGATPLLYFPTSPGFITLYKSIPSWYSYKEYFYPCLGSLSIMLSLTYCPPLQRLFQTRFPQYLGRISFSLYLLHTQILVTLGIRVFSWAMKFVGGGETQMGFTMGMALGASIVGPFTFWASDVFTRVVDERCVEFARWIAGKALHFD